MKIDANQLTAEGLTLHEEFASGALDLDTDIIKFHTPIKVRADISRITNALTVFLTLDGLMYAVCSRCLNEFPIDLKKKIRLGYSINNLEPIIDLGPDIRDHILLECPIKPLCRTDCKGLCVKCGKNLNEGACNC